jgi:uncharacterized protein YcgL (UPF0745 family)
LKYELDLFFRIINSGLLSESNANPGFKNHITFLQGRFKQCIKHYKINFRQNTSGEYSLIHVKKYAFLDLPGVLHQEVASDNDTQLLDKIIAQFLTITSIDRESISKAQYTQSKKELYVEITAQVEFTHLKPQEAKFHYYRTLLHDEVERIKHSLQHQSFHLQSEKQIELFIQHHQLTLETLTQSLFSCLSEEDRKNLYNLSDQYTLTDLYKTVYQYLEKVQRHIEQYFTKYLAIDASIPYRSRLLSSVEIDKKLKLVYEHLTGNDLDEKLLKIIHKLLTKLAHITLEERFTYQALIYYKMVLDELYAAVNVNKHSFTNERLTEILYRLNFNSVDFFHYITSHIEDVVAREERYEGKKNLLYYYQKIYRQRLVRTNMFYQKSLLSIKTQVLNWLQEEIYYLEKISEGKLEKDKAESNTGQNKITTQLSVAQLAYILKVMHETGLITATSQWDMFRFVQENVGSKRKDTISAQSLNNKYYNVEAATKTSVKDLLLKILHHINKAK